MPIYRQGDTEQRLKRYRKARDRVLFIGTLIPLAATLAARFLEYSLPYDVIAAVFATLAFVSALTVFIGQKSMEVEIEHHKAELASQHERVLKAVEDSCLVDSLKGTLKEIRETRPHSFQVYADSALRQLKRELDNVIGGKLEISDSEKLAIPLALASNVQKSLDTTAFFENDPTTITDDYHDALTDAIQDEERQVRIRRLFLIREGIEDSKEFRERLKKEIDAGVQVRYRFFNAWIGSHEVPSSVDFGVWDRELVWIYTDDPEATFDEMRPRILHGEVDEYEKVFEQNWSKATIPDLG